MSDGAGAAHLCRPMVICVAYLGRLEYSTSLALQEKLVSLRKAGRIGNVLLLLEHPPVLTLGRNADRANILAPEALLRARGVDIVETNRGGDVTYHGPGQLIGYPIFDLRSFSTRMGAVDFVRKIEEVLIRSCAEYGVLTERVRGRTGVWTQPPLAAQPSAERKIAAIGVHISGGVSSHGFALNVTTDLADFRWIVPCGIGDREVTSLEVESPASRARWGLEETAHTVSRQFGRVFDSQMLWLESLDGLFTTAGQPSVEATVGAPR